VASSLSHKKPQAQDDGSSFATSRSFQRPAMAARPHSSSRYLSSSSSSASQSFPLSISPGSDGSGSEEEDDDVSGWGASGEVTVRPRKTLVKRYAKESSQRSTRESPEYIQRQLVALGSDVVYSFEDYLNE
jgi:hypothetical protein